MQCALAALQTLPTGPSPVGPPALQAAPARLRVLLGMVALLLQPVGKMVCGNQSQATAR